VFDHHPRAARGFFGGLENEMHRAVEIARLRQIFCGAAQHGAMTVMAAGMHDVRMDRSMGKSVFLLHGQGVHIGTETDAARGMPDLERPDVPGSSQSAMDLDTKLLKPRGDEVRGRMFLEGKFRMLVQMATPNGQFISKFMEV